MISSAIGPHLQILEENWGQLSQPILFGKTLSIDNRQEMWLRYCKRTVMWNLMTHHLVAGVCKLQNWMTNTREYNVSRTDSITRKYNVQEHICTMSFDHIHFSSNSYQIPSPVGLDFFPKPTLIRALKHINLPSSPPPTRSSGKERLLGNGGSEPA